MKKQIKMKKTKKQIKNIFPISPNRKYSVCRTKIFKLKNISRGKLESNLISKMWWLMKTTIPSLPYITNNTQPFCHTKKRWETVIDFSLIFPFSKERKMLKLLCL